MKSSKRSLLASGASLLVSAALLVGSTFAWFTDSVTNTGNKIEAGTLAINAYAYDLANDAGEPSFTIKEVNGGKEFSFEQKEQDLNISQDPIISEPLWEPGVSSAKLLKVENAGTLAVKIKLQFKTDGELTNALWFDFVQVKDGKVTGTFTKRPMSTLSTFAENLELPLVESGDSLQFILVYGMYEDAGNEYQNKDFTADVTILGAQYTSEMDGFGSNQYDAQAKYPVKTEVDDKDSLEEALNTSGVPVEITLSKSLQDLRGGLNVTGDVTLNMDKNMLSSSSSIVGASITVKEGGSLSINAIANDYGFDYTAGGLTAVGQDSTLVINGGRYGISGAFGAEVAGKDGGTVTINDGIFSCSGYQGHAVMATNGATVYVKGGQYSVAGASSIAMYADGGTIVVENCTFTAVNGKRYGAVNGGQILLSKTCSPSKPTSVVSGCTVTDNGDYWLISAE